MSNLLNSCNLAKALGVNSGIITLAKKAGHIVHDLDGMYNILDPKNKFWIDGQIAKGKTFDIGRIINSKFLPKEPKKPKTVVIKDEPKPKTDGRRKPRMQTHTPTDSEEASEVSGLYDAKLKLEIKKLKNQDKLDELKIAKIEGQLLPVVSVEGIFLWAAENFRKTYEQDVDNMINIFIKRLGGEQKDFIEMKKLAMESLAMTGQSLKENMLSGLENAITEYSEVRGRGERQ